MSEIDNLESLSNAELRAQCIKYGLPNVPVTDSSRNVLIKKIRTTVSGSPALGSKKTSASSNRRETIHSSKVYPSIEAVKAATASKDEIVGAPKSPGRSANRRTIGSLPSSQNRRKNLSMTEPTVTTNSSTSAAEPVSVKHSTVRNIVPHKVTAPVGRQHVILESDEEDDNIMVAAVRRAEQLSSYKGIGAADPHARSRSSRSASLSKTGVLTTSYVQETVPVASPSIIDLDEDDEEEEEEGELLESPVRNVELAPPQKTFNTYRTNDTTATHAARQDNFVAPRMYSSPPQSSRYTFGVDSGITANANANPTGIPRYNESVLKPTSRYTLGGEASSIASRFSPTTQNQPNYYSPSTVRHSSSTVTSTNMRSSMLPPTARPIVANVRTKATYYTEHSDTDTNNEDENNLESPFLSDYARTLGRRKGDALGGDGDGELSRRSFFKRSTNIYESPGRRPKINANDDVSLAQIFNALDQKYNIKRNFALLMVLMLVIFLFVLFWK